MHVCRQVAATKTRLLCDSRATKHSYTVIEDRMIPFAAYTTAETPNAFQRTGQPSKIAPSSGDIDPIVPWPHGSQPPNGISIGSAVFAGRIRVINRQTDRQTDQAMCDIRSSRPHLCTALID